MNNLSKTFNTGDDFTGQWFQATGNPARGDWNSVDLLVQSSDKDFKVRMTPDMAKGLVEVLQKAIAHAEKQLESRVAD